jgi:hypothetical protein
MDALLALLMEGNEKNKVEQSPLYFMKMKYHQFSQKLLKGDMSTMACDGSISLLFPKTVD